MPYDTYNPPALIAQGISRGSNNDARLWHYSSADSLAVVLSDNYFSNGYALGIRTGDLVRVMENDAITSTDLLVISSSADEVIVIDNSTSSTQLRVHDIGQFPDPEMIDGELKIRPLGREYELNVDVDSLYPLTHPGDGKRFTLKAVNGAKWNYLGTGSAISDLDARGDIEFDGQLEITAVNGTLFDCETNGGSASFQATHLVRLRDTLGLGRVQGPNYQWNVQDGSITGFGTGLDAKDTSFFEVNTVFVSGAGTDTTTYFRVHGDQTSGAVNLVLVSTSTSADETVFDLDKDIEQSVNSVLLDTIQKDGPFLGAVFAPDSLDQTNPIVTGQGSEGLFPNSTVKARLEITDNSLITTIGAQNTPVPINATWNDGAIEERLCFQDYCTFDNTTNTITSVNNVLSDAPYNHGLTNGDIIFPVEDGGLPAELIDKQEYFVINATAQTFQISLTSGGSAVEFTDDGTPNNYFCHATGVSPSGWVIYTGLQPASIIINGWVSIEKSGSAQSANVRVIKTSATFVETDGARGGNVTISNNISAPSPVSDVINRSRYEGIRIYMEGRDVTPDNLIAKDANMTFSKA